MNYVLVSAVKLLTILWLFDDGIIFILLSMSLLKLMPIN